MFWASMGSVTVAGSGNIRLRRVAKVKRKIRTGQSTKEVKVAVVT